MDMLKLTARLILDTSDYIKGINNAQETSTGAMDKIKGTIAKLGIGTALGKMAMDAVNVSKSFDSSVSQIAATLGKTADEVTDLREKALEMGSATNFTATQAADGLNILAMSGYDAAQSMDMIEDVLHLAAAGSMDMANAAGYISTTMKGFNDETKDSAYYADLMAKGATLANTSVAQLGEAMSAGASGAAAYSQSADSMTVALLRLAEQGEVGSAAGTALAAAMKNLYTPTDQAIKALKALNVDAYDPVTHAARDFNEVVNDLDAALNATTADGLAKYTEEQKNAYKQTIFGIQGLDAYNKMTVTGTEKQEEWAEALAHASDGAGEAAKQYDTMTDNIQGDLDLMQSAFEGLQIRVAEKFTPALRGGIQALGDFLSGISSGLDGGNLLQTGREWIQKLGEGLVEGIPEMLSNVLPNILTITENLRTEAGAFVDTGIEFILNMAQGLMDGLPTLIEYVPQIIENIAGIINDNAPKIFQAGWQLIVMLAQGLWNALPAVVSNIGNIMSAAIAVIQAINWVSLGSKIITFIGNGITALAASIPSALKSIATNGMNAIKNIDWIGIGKSIIDGIVAGIKSIGGNILGALSGAVTSAVEGVKGFLGIKSPSRLFRDEVGKMIPAGIAEGIKDNTQSIFDAMAEIPDVAMNGFQTATDTSQTAGPAGSTGTDTIIELLKAIVRDGIPLGLDLNEQQIFKVVRKQDKMYRTSNGRSAFGY